MVDWISKKDRRMCKPGDTASVTKFAWLPVKCDDGRVYWLQRVTYTWHMMLEDESLENIPHPLDCDEYSRWDFWDDPEVMPFKN